MSILRVGKLSFWTDFPFLALVWVIAVDGDYANLMPTPGAEHHPLQKICLHRHP